VSKIVEYGDYTISSIPVQKMGTSEWQPSVVISTEREGIVTTQTFTDDTSFSTELDADLHGITMGQQIIDGQAPAVSDQLDNPGR
jgi:hypothetical protein